MNCSSGGAGPSSQLSQEDYIAPSVNAIININDIAPSAEPVAVDLNVMMHHEEGEDRMDASYYPSLARVCLNGHLLLIFHHTHYLSILFLFLGLKQHWRQEKASPSHICRSK